MMSTVAMTTNCATRATSAVSATSGSSSRSMPSYAKRTRAHGVSWPSGAETRRPARCTAHLAGCVAPVNGALRIARIQSRLVRSGRDAPRTRMAGRMPAQSRITTEQTSRNEERTVTLMRS
jgi:hypothetical protein